MDITYIFIFLGILTSFIVEINNDSVKEPKDPKEKRAYHFNRKLKLTALAVILVGSFAACINDIESDMQLDLMRKTGEKSAEELAILKDTTSLIKKITNQTRKLAEINDTVVSNIRTLVSLGNELTDRNLEVTKNSKEIIDKNLFVTEKTNVLADSLEKLTLKISDFQKKQFMMATGAGAIPIIYTNIYPEKPTVVRFDLRTSNFLPLSAPNVSFEILRNDNIQLQPKVSSLNFPSVDQSGIRDVLVVELKPPAWNNGGFVSTVKIKVSWGVHYSYNYDINFRRFSEDLYGIDYENFHLTVHGKTYSYGYDYKYKKNLNENFRFKMFTEFFDRHMEIPF